MKPRKNKRDFRLEETQEKGESKVLPPLREIISVCESKEK